VLLLVSAIVSFITGEHVDGIIIVVIMFINAFLGFLQEFKASKASEKLMRLVETKVYVLRAGILTQIPASELVLGDIIHLVAGSVVPADVQVVESLEASIDDSVRTGETVPHEIKMGDNIFAGATVSSGKVIGHVIALGGNSSLAKYRAKLESVKKWSSFSLFTESVIRYVFILSLITLIVSLFLLVFVMGKYELASFFTFAIAMLVGVVPEMLPLIITLILTREALLLSKHKVIVKRLSSLESLGAVQFLLTDKTGTITENKLKVSAVSDVNNFWELSNAITASTYERTPMDEAYDHALESSIGKIPTPARTVVSFEPFRRDVGYQLFTLEGGEKIARGIIGKIVALCEASSGKDMKLDTILKGALAYEEKGMRVIAQASGIAGVWTFSGFVALYDPIKSSAAESLKIAHKRGIGVKILTGDSRAVATSVAEELHLIQHPDNIISLDQVEIKSLSDRELRRVVVFSKCTPENKLELINRYVKLGPVAFLGDGINDALALKRADIGIAVDNATDLAKESADIILLEKDLSPMLQSVSTGRRALRNILTYIMYTLSGNAGTFFSLLVASFFYPVLPMLPIQILLNNLLTDIPLMLIITDNADEYALRHVPHFEPKKVMIRVFVFGIISSVFDLIYFECFKHAPVAEFQTGWFMFSIFAELVLILSIRSSRSLSKSPAIPMPLLVAIAVTFISPFVFVYNNALGAIFKFTELRFTTVAMLIFITLIYITANECAKYIMRRKNVYNKPPLPAEIFRTT
jgi:Mg2+-importing ATPase